MYKECKTTQSMSRQYEIAQSLCSMMVQQNYEEISVSSLCKKADIPRKSFYRYFDTKDDAFNFLVDKQLLGADAYRMGHRIASMRITPEMLNERFSSLKEQKSFIEAIAKNQMSIPTIQRMCETVVAQLKQHGEYMQLDTEMKITMTISIIFGIVMSWYHSGFKTSCDEMAEAAYKLLTKPLIDENDFFA